MTMRTEVLDRSRGGMWPWLGQRVTAVLVLVTIMIHLILTHYVAIGHLSYSNIGARLAGGAVVVNTSCCSWRSSSTASTACAWSCLTGA